MDEYNPDTLSPVDAFDAVASEPRQVVLDVLLTADDGHVELEALANEVADELTKIENTDTYAESVEELKLALMHHHLPRLEDDDLVEFDQDRQIVEAGRHIDDVDPLV